MNPLLRFYLTIRKPRNFLILLCIFIGVSMVLHFLHGYDADFGATNLILSIEASTAGAVLMMIAEGSAEAQQRMLETILALEERLLEIDERILKVLTKGESDDQF